MIKYLNHLTALINNINIHRGWTMKLKHWPKQYWRFHAYTCAAWWPIFTECKKRV